MQSQSIFALLALAIGAQAVTTHIITVGQNATLNFSPDSMTAAVGDTLEFHFYTGTGHHSVVSSTFSSPCQPNTNAFFSGYITGDANGTSTFSVPVTSTDPIWYYCSLGKHCAEGMAGVVNPPAGEDIAAYKAAASGLSASAPSAVEGGTVSTGGPTASSATGTFANSTSSVAGVSKSTTVATTTASGTGAGITATSSTSSAGAVATTKAPNDAGRSNDVSVMVALGVVVGGLVALLA